MENLTKPHCPAARNYKWEELICLFHARLYVERNSVAEKLFRKKIMITKW
jgi:hypothetical protein